MGKKKLTLEEKRFRWEKKEAKIKREDELKKSAIDGASSAAPTIIKALLLFGGQYFLFRANWDKRTSAVTAALFTGLALSDIDSDLLWGSIVGLWGAHGFWAFAKGIPGALGEAARESKEYQTERLEQAVREQVGPDIPRKEGFWFRAP